MNVIFKTFTSPSGLKYVFDRDTNTIFNVNDEEFLSFQNIEAKKINERDIEVLKRYQEKGLCKEAVLKKIEHPDTPFIPFYLESRVQQITLCLTQQCTLRCSYCEYSGNYENQRTHSNKKMSLEVMKKSVDFIMEHSRDLDNVAIAFFGGEPMLEMNSIRECIQYIKNEYKDKDVIFTMTTNGTLLNNDTDIQFLSDNDFHLLISLDGPKEMHDKNRVYPNGKGSFDDIMANLHYVSEYFPDFFKKIAFGTVVAPGNDLGCIRDFYDVSELFLDNNILKSTVNSFSSKNEINYDDQFFITNNFQQTKILLAALKLYSKNKTSKLFNADFSLIHRFYKTLSCFMGSSFEFSHPGGPCVPGVMRPFINVYGDIYPCERISETSEILKIGNIYTGYDLNKILNILNVAKISEEECKQCWNFNHCSLCVAASDDNDKLSKQKRLSHCQSIKITTLKNLKTICLLKEFKYDFESEL